MAQSEELVKLLKAQMIVSGTKTDLRGICRAAAMAAASKGKLTAAEASAISYAGRQTHYSIAGVKKLGELKRLVPVVAKHFVQALPALTKAAENVTVRKPPVTDKGRAQIKAFAEQLCPLAAKAAEMHSAYESAIKKAKKRADAYRKSVQPEIAALVKTSKLVLQIAGLVMTKPNAPEVKTALAKLAGMPAPKSKALDNARARTREACN